MRICEWCKTNLAFDGELCNDCTVVLAPKNQVQALHARVDEHIGDCVFCSVTLGVPTLCAIGTGLLIEAEYAQHFSPIDPQQWFRQYGREEPFPHG